MFNWPVLALIGPRWSVLAVVGAAHLSGGDMALIGPHWPALAFAGLLAVVGPREGLCIC